MNTKKFMACMYLKNEVAYQDREGACRIEETPVALAERAVPTPMPVPRPLDLLPKSDTQAQAPQPRVAQPGSSRRNRSSNVSAPS